MSIRVVFAAGGDLTQPCEEIFAQADRFEVESHADLYVYGSSKDRPIAVVAHGRWIYAVKQ